MSCCTAPAAKIEAKPPQAMLNTQLEWAARLDLPVVLRHADWQIGAGFHITEIKHAQVRGLDCGRNEEAWDETRVQLLDLPGPEESRMKSGKFVNILDHKELLGDLVLEIGAPGKSMQLFQVSAMDEQAGALVIHLNPSAAQCKPAFRAQTAAPQQNAESGCCGKSEGACCG